MDKAFVAEMEKEGWSVFDCGGHLEIQVDDERVGEIEDGPETDAQALECAKLFLARKVQALLSWEPTRPERYALHDLATAILNTEEGM